MLLGGILAAENDQLVVSFVEKDGTMTKHVNREVSVADYKEMTKVDWETTRGPLDILPMSIQRGALGP